MWFEWWPSYEPETPEIGNSEPIQADRFSDLERQAGELTGNPSHTVAWASESDKGVIDSSLNAAQIQNQILATQASIAELEAKDALTGQDRREIYLLKKQLVELETSQLALEEQETASNTATIESEKLETANNAEAIADKTETLKNYNEISCFLSPEILAQYPALRNKLAWWNEALAVIRAGERDTTPAENDALRLATKEAVDYLKNNQQVTAHIYRDLGGKDSTEGEAFKSFLVSQDISFTAIFDEIESTDTHIC